MSAVLLPSLPAASARAAVFLTCATLLACTNGVTADCSNGQCGTPTVLPDGQADSTVGASDDATVDAADDAAGDAANGAEDGAGGDAQDAARDAALEAGDASADAGDGGAGRPADSGRE
ncbi:MAG: hypothetical protein ACREJ3_13225 [Polyangiaceae bacterium]